MSERRQQILAIAAELFAEKGFHGVSIAELVDAALEAARPLLDEHHHALKVTLAPDLYVEGDRGRLVQALQNLSRTRPSTRRMMGRWRSTPAPMFPPSV